MKIQFCSKIIKIITFELKFEFLASNIRRTAQNSSQKDENSFFFKNHQKYSCETSKNEQLSLPRKKVFLIAATPGVFWGKRFHRLTLKKSEKNFKHKIKNKMFEFESCLVSDWPTPIFFGPYFCAKIGFLDPKILKNITFFKIHGFGSNNSQHTQAHT